MRARVETDGSPVGSEPAVPVVVTPAVAAGSGLVRLSFARSDGVRFCVVLLAEEAEAVSRSLAVEAAVCRERDRAAVAELNSVPVRWR